MALFTYQFNKPSANRRPIGRTLLDYNVEKNLNDIKYEMKYSQGKQKRDNEAAASGIGLKMLIFRRFCI